MLFLRFFYLFFFSDSFTFCLFWLKRIHQKAIFFRKTRKPQKIMVFRKVLCPVIGFFFFFWLRGSVIKLQQKPGHIEQGLSPNSKLTWLDTPCRQIFIDRKQLQHPPQVSGSSRKPALLGMECSLLWLAPGKPKATQTMTNF